MKNKLMILVLFSILVGCASKYEDRPAKIGTGKDDMKKSRCACKVFYEDGEWL